MILVAAAVVLLFGFTAGAAAEPADRAHGARPEPPDSAREYRRIISLSPSTTETLFALGLGDRVAGVTRFCNYPPEARRLKRVGGYLDPNYEVIASLGPDLVILLPEQERARSFLDELGLRYITVDNKTVRNILGTIETIGTACGAGEAAHALVDSIETQMALIREATQGLPCPRVLVAVERTVEAGTLREVYVAGRRTHYDELIRAAGGVNAFEGKRIDYPMLTAEGIIHCNPEIIIDIRPLLDADSSRIEGAVREWATVPAIEAVKNGRIHVLTGDYAVIPGPRFIMLLREMARIIHPDVRWDDR
ncbi:MAG TPA: helical backbone metal receptor [Patescibacteria group bacterium]|nr:helical backbone metal receptor [Patescibacteria group bacterium]